MPEGAPIIGPRDLLAAAIRAAQDCDPDGENGLSFDQLLPLVVAEDLVRLPRWLSEPHGGDCVKAAPGDRAPVTCCRCVADRFYALADALLALATRPLPTETPE